MRFLNFTGKELFTLGATATALTSWGMLSTTLPLTSPSTIPLLMAISTAEAGLGYGLLKFGRQYLPRALAPLGNLIDRVIGRLDNNYQPEAEIATGTPRHYKEYSGASKVKDRNLLLREKQTLLAEQPQTVFNSFTQPSAWRQPPLIAREAVQYTIPAHQNPINSRIVGGHNLRARH